MHQFNPPDDGGGGSSAETVDEPDRKPVGSGRTGLLSLGEETPVAVEGCGEDGCDPNKIEPVDLYCGPHERLLIAGRREPGRGRWIVVNLARFAICGAVVLAAWAHTAIPLYVLFVAAGLAIGAGPLFRFRMTAKVAAGAWLVAATVAAIVPLFDSSVEAAIRTVLVGLVIVLAVLHAGAFAWSVKQPTGTTAPAVTVATFASVPAMLLGWLLSHPSHGLVEVPQAVRHWLYVGTVTGIAGTLLVAAIAGTIRGQAGVERHVDPLLTARATPWRVEWQVLPAQGSHSASSSFERTLSALATRVVAAAVASARGVVNLLLRAAHLAQVLAVRGANWVHRRLVMTARRLVAALRATGRVLAESAALGREVLGRTAQVVLLPAVMVTVASVAAGYGASAALRYLVEGGAGAGAAMVAGMTGVVVALSSLWILLAPLPVGVSGASWLRSASIAGPHVVVMFTIAGWVIGLPGSLGYGPIRVGVLTITFTVLLIGLVVWARRKRTPRSAAGSPDELEGGEFHGATA